MPRRAGETTERHPASHSPVAERSFDRARRRDRQAQPEVTHTHKGKGSHAYDERAQAYPRDGLEVTRTVLDVSRSASLEDHVRTASQAARYGWESLLGSPPPGGWTPTIGPVPQGPVRRLEGDTPGVGLAPEGAPLPRAAPHLDANPPHNPQAESDLAPAARPPLPTSSALPPAVPLVAPSRLPPRDSLSERLEVLLGLGVHASVPSGGDEDSSKGIAHEPLSEEEQWLQLIDEANEPRRLWQTASVTPRLEATAALPSKRYEMTSKRSGMETSAPRQDWPSSSNLDMAP